MGSHETHGQMNFDFEGDKKNEAPLPKKGKPTYQERVEAEMRILENNPEYSDYSPEDLRREAEVIVHNRESSSVRLYGDHNPNPHEVR